MTTIVDPTARAARFTSKVVYHEDPRVVAELQQLATEARVSSSAIVQSAVRAYLARVDTARRAR